MHANERMPWGVGVFALLVLVWVVLDGTGSLLVGVPTAAIATAVGMRLRPGDRRGWRASQLPGFAWYFLVESLRGSLDVARRALHPALPIAPHLAHYPIALPPGAPRTMLIGIVSLLPGTLGARLRSADDPLVLHAITPQPRAGVAELERRIAALFGLALEPRT